MLKGKYACTVIIFFLLFHCFEWKNSFAHEGHDHFHDTAPVTIERSTYHEVGVNERMSAQRLWKYMTVEAPYQQYPAWPGKEGLYESSMPPGNILKLYINNYALDTVVNKKGIFPYGSLLIKEMYTDDKKMYLITVMYKEKDFNPEGHDWYWVKYGPNGDVQMEGKVELCIECHEGMVENDYVFTGSIK